MSPLFNTLNGLTATPAGGPLVVTIPPAATPPNGPTGQVNNNTASFVITQTGAPTAAHFIFADLNGGVEYKVTDRISIFGQVNNILNTTNQVWLYYPNYGFNIFGGVGFHF